MRREEHEPGPDAPMGIGGAPFGAPFILRIAGLPAERIMAFATDLVSTRVVPALQIEDELGAARAGIIDRIEAGLTNGEPLQRRFLLQVKRDCFNRRRLRKHARSPHWPALQALAGMLADRIIELEDRQARLASELQEAYERARASELDHLEHLLAEQSFVRGVTLASPVLLDNAHRLRRAQDGRKAVKLRASLLRYASRAAIKTSPFSTLTRLAIGLVEGSEDTGGLRLIGHDWHARSLLRFKRYIFDQDYSLLLRYRPFRDTMQVTLNNSVQDVEDGRLCFLRPGIWRTDADAERLRYELPALVHAALSGPLVTWLRQRLAGRSWAHDELLQALERTFADGQRSDKIRATIDKLLEIGFLQLQRPWPSNAGHMEACMLEHLRALPDAPALAPMIESLDRIVTLERSYATTSEPLRVFHALERAADSLWDATCALDGVDAPRRRTRQRATALYEDVFLLPDEQTASAQEQRPWQELARIPRATVDRIVRSTLPLARLAHLYGPQHDFLLALEAFAKETWPDRHEIGLFDLFRAAQPLWRQYSKFLVERSRETESNAWIHAPFDPFGLPAVAALRACRERVWPQVEARVQHGEDESVLAGAALDAILAEVPARYVPPLDACLMLQPLDTEGRRWMLNRLYEGFGRYGSRYTTVMPEQLRRRYTAHLAERGVYEQHGRRTELLDLLCTSGETLNIHAVQTPRVLELPDEHLDVSPEHRLHVGDLRFRMGEADRPPMLCDAAGRPYAPLHLGVASHAFMPPLIKFLSALGPGEIKSVPLPRHVREGQAMTVTNRLRVDDVVVYRRRWRFEPEAVPAGLLAQPESQAFVALHRWRLAHDIPERVFLIEEVREGVYKPQYLDLTSPSFVAVLRASINAGGGGITFYEMLPTPEMLPADEAGQRWAVELQIDTLALRAPPRPQEPM